MIKVETNNSLVARYDDVIPLNICGSIVNYIRRVKPNRSVTEALPWLQHDNVPFKHMDNKPLQQIVDKYRFLLTQLVYEQYKTIAYPHFTDFVVWRKGMKMLLHKDNGYEGYDQETFRPRVFSMVTYLNDDYVGGETVIQFEDGSEYVSVPKAGSVVIFKANEECQHKVNEILEGTRYTMATWFATDVNHCELAD